MQPSMSSAPAPLPDRGKPGTPTRPAPALVPPAPRRSRRPRMLAGLGAAVAAIAGLLVYLNTGRGPKVPGPPANVAVRTVAVYTGDLQTTVRVNGVVSAE